jgi:hypothetical protein
MLSIDGIIKNPEKSCKQAERYDKRGQVPSVRKWKIVKWEKVEARSFEQKVEHSQLVERKDFQREQ